MNLNLERKVIIVTGGAEGIGNGICNVLSGEGAITVIVDKSKAESERAVRSIKNIGGEAFFIKAELGRPEASERVVKTTLEKFSRIDGLVNNAGLNDGVGLERGSYSGFIRSLHRNLTHYYLTAHYALPELIKTHGSIVNISSNVAETGQGDTSAYAASNGGRDGLTREWAVELLKYEIRVNAVVVSECFTPQYKKWIQKFPDPDKQLKYIRKRIPFQHRMTTVTEIGNMVAFLLSDRSSHTTGQLIHVDGGYVHLDRTV